MANSITIPSGIIPISRGGTGANNSANARTALEIAKTYGRTNYYVSNSGNDSTGDGTSNKPFATIQKALDSSKKIQFVCIYISSGTYNEHLIVTSSSVVELQAADHNGTVTIVAPNDESDNINNICINVWDSSQLTIRGNFTFKNNGRNAHISAQGNVSVNFTKHSDQNDSLLTFTTDQNTDGSYSSVIGAYGGRISTNDSVKMSIKKNYSGFSAHKGGWVQIQDIVDSTISRLFIANGGIILYKSEPSNSTIGTEYTCYDGGRVYRGAMTSAPNY